MINAGMTFTKDDRNKEYLVSIIILLSFISFYISINNFCYYGICLANVGFGYYLAWAGFILIFFARNKS